MTWEEHMVGIENAYSILVENPEEKKPLGRQE
jgi:hypothetical protein